MHAVGPKIGPQTIRRVSVSVTRETGPGQSYLTYLTTFLLPIQRTSLARALA
jgi:hypothetical protein